MTRRCSSRSGRPTRRRHRPQVGPSLGINPRRVPLAAWVASETPEPEQSDKRRREAQTGSIVPREIGNPGFTPGPRHAKAHRTEHLKAFAPTARLDLLKAG